LPLLKEEAKVKWVRSVMSVLYFLAIVLFLFLCLVLSIVVLIQESKSSGLGASFGGGDSGDSVFGVSTPQILKIFTAYLAAIFLVSCVVLSFWTSTRGRGHISSAIPTELVD
jgi:preprotein translocase subunit SecG